MMAGDRTKVTQVMVGVLVLTVMVGVLVLTVMLAAAAPGLQGSVSAAPGEATNWGTTTLPPEVAGLGATEAWWAAARTNIRQDIVQPEGARGILGLSTDPDWDFAGVQASDRFGYSVASAGDVNGDGYADVIVGAPGLSGMGKRGKAHVFLGSATGLETSPDWSQIGENDDDRFGWSVAGAGDVNGDGFDDVIVGAYLYGDAGRAYVFLGSDSGLSPSSLSPLDGESGGATFGYSVAGAGDVNGDGYADVMVADRGYNTAQGKVYVYHGGASGPDTTADRTLTGEDTQDWFGQSLAGAGDVNGDGYADVIVGATGYDDGAITQIGAAYVFHGSPTGVDGTWAWKKAGETRDDWFGSSVAGAGDVNGDGYADVIVGAKYYGGDFPGDPEWGAAYVYHGSTGGLNDGAWDWRVVGENDGDRFGASVAGAGDVNGDGYADVLVGAPEVGTTEGRAYAYRGSLGGLAAGPSWVEDGEATDNYFALSVSGAGDVNGDGYADVLVGAEGFSLYQGKAYAYHGAGDLPGGDDQWGEEGANAGDQFGYSVASAGDVNGDGYADVIVGARGFNSSQGRAYVYLGSADGLPASPLWHADGENGNDGFGSSVAAAGDVNGDGYGDVIVGAPGYDDGGNGEAGKAYVYYGGESDLNDVPWEAVGEAANSEFGARVAGAGDVNGDGYADIIISAPGYDSSRGKVYVHYGASKGLPATASRTYEGGDAAERFGSAVAGVGDTNGDGYADVAIGAEGYPSPAGSPRHQGKVELYLGAESGLGPASAWTSLGENYGDNFGIAVAGAGDVDGDGCGDILVGADGFDSARGKAYLYHGGCGGGPPSSAWAGLGNLASDAFGYAVSGAGDVNGDGYADVIVGAFQSPTGIDLGSTYLYAGPLSGTSTLADWEKPGQYIGDQFGISVAGAGDVNGDGFADVIIGANLYNSSRGKVYAYLGNDSGGQLVLARPMRQDAMQVQPWGLTDEIDRFRVRMWATNPAGRSRLKLEVEACPPGAAFGYKSCKTATSTTWQDSVPVGGNPPPKGLSLQISGLDGETLYRWRARVLYAPFTVQTEGITSPPNPAHGPWRRFLGQGMEADLRTAPCTRGWSVTPTTVAKTGHPGETVTYNMRVTNDGDCSDTVDVVASGNAWKTNTPTTVGPLAAGAQEKLYVTVEVPAGTSDGDSDSATITFTSQGDPDESASSILTTTVVEDWTVFLPIVTRQND